MYIVIRESSFNEEDYSIVAFSYRQEDAEKSLKKLSKGNEYAFRIINKEEEENEDNF